MTMTSGLSAYELSPEALRASPASDKKSPGLRSTCFAASMVTFDLGFRRLIKLHEITSFEEIGTLYNKAIEELASLLGSPVTAWKLLRMGDLTSFHQMRVYKICPNEEFKPVLGEIELSSGSLRRLILFRTKTSSGYILLV